MNDDFEKRIRRVAPREVPSAWREEILAAARSAEISRPAPCATPRGWLSSLMDWLAIVMLPRPVAWAGVAAAWIVIIALNIAAQDDSAPAGISYAAAVVSPETLQALQQQRLLLAELVDRAKSHPMNRPKSRPTGPRSQRREVSATA